MKIKNKPLCIIGGMGPEASGYLYKLLIELSIKFYGAKHNNDFPEIILDSIPVPDFISNDSAREEAFIMIRDRIKDLKKIDPICFSLACNTAHALLKDLKKNTQIPFISMIDVVIDQVSKNNLTRVGILASPSTLKYGLYQDKLSKKEIEFLIPSEKDYLTLEKSIRSVISGDTDQDDIKFLVKIADDLIKQGAEGIILGCTELPLIFPKDYSLPVFNSVEILADCLLQKYYQQNRIEQI